MAYVSKELKAKVAAQLKIIMPKDWKYSLAVHHRSQLVLTISKAPVDLNKIVINQLNEHHLKDRLMDLAYLSLFTQIFAAMNIDNHDNSDIQSDYFDVGHYVNVQIGTWEKPFICTVSETV